MKQRDRDSIQTIQEKCEKIINETSKLSESEFFANDTIIASTLWNITVIGEAANRLSAESIAEDSGISLRAAISMRHRIVHGYDSIDEATVYKVATVEIPQLLAELHRQSEE
jgi:uncharacterized protein with HEPN domain